MSMMWWLALAMQAAAPAPAPASSAAAPVSGVVDLGANLERFAYPWPVRQMAVPLASGEAAQVAFMDVRPKGAGNGRTVVLLHGKNFCGATWEATARALLADGYRVVIPDQIGFCKSSKPVGYQYTLVGMAATTEAVLRQIGVTRASVVGHSMGGMLAMRFAIQFPERVERLVLVNPLGLVDRLAQGVPYSSVAKLFEGERKTNAASIKAYQLRNYYHGTWKPEYDRWVRMAAGMSAGVGRDTVALAQAKTSQMILTQPVFYELERIIAPTTLMVGGLDETAFGRAEAPEALRALLPAIPKLAPAAVRRIKGAKLVRWPDLGHSPQVEAPARFQQALREALAGR